MLNHPSTKTPFSKVVTLALFVVWEVALVLLLRYYAVSSVGYAAAAGIGYGVVLAVLAYVYWYVLDHLSALSGRVIIAGIVQVVSLGGYVLSLVLCGFEDFPQIASFAPLLATVGLLSWAALDQYYQAELLAYIFNNEDYTLDYVMSVGDDKSAKSAESNESTMSTKFVETTEAVLSSDQIAETESGEPQTVETLNRISVKDGQQIHIIPVEELYYLQSYGDYVLLHTNSGKYIKEQTMKFFESNLPDNFIRIHRSYIINSNMISRVELFGKENYQLKLKNGVCLKISISGYKALKTRLML